MIGQVKNQMRSYLQKGTTAGGTGNFAGELQKRLGTQHQPAVTDTLLLSSINQAKNTDKTQGATPWAGDKYNPGKPYGARAEAVLRTLAELREEGKNADYTGMSDVEIYKSIYDRYDKAFGGNFAGACAGGLSVFMAVGEQWTGIDVQTQMLEEAFSVASPELQQKLWGQIPHDPIEKNEMFEFDNQVFLNLEYEALYGGMSEGERWSSIQKKYVDKGTTILYLSYAHELKFSGLITFDEECDLRSAAIHTASKKACVTLGIAPGGNRSIAYFDTILKNFIRSNELLTRTQSAAYRPLADRLLGKLGFDLSD